MSITQLLIQEEIKCFNVQLVFFLNVKKRFIRDYDFIYYVNKTKTPIKHHNPPSVLQCYSVQGAKSMEAMINICLSPLK